jgi:tetratricopeptide (TPR) repeat protein/transcriptional regulator with XRE-family HTH domain
VTTGQALSFGDLLRRHRVAAGLTQEELAERAGLSVRAVSDLERGIKSRPHRDTVRLLAEALRLDGPACAAFEAARGRGAAASIADAAPGAATARVTRRRETVPPFVGRASELALLERHLAGKGPPVLMLAGEPGIGKSRLLREATVRAADHGWHVLQGGCQRRDGQEPFAPLLGALTGDLGHRSAVQVRAALHGCAWLVRLLPELATGPIEPLPTWTLPPEQERRLMFAAVERFLANVAGPTGTLLVLDDLQWAGSDALDLLATLVRSTLAGVRLVGAFRDSEVATRDALSIMLADLAHAGLAAQRTLAPLTPQEVGQLLAALLEGTHADRDGLRERVAQRTGGVPFYVVSCAQVLRQDEGESDQGADAVPWDVAQGIRQRVAALSDVTQEVLGVAAVIGRVVWPALLIAACEQGEREAIAALEAASRARLLLELEEEGAYQFTHDLIREVVEADVGAARRALLHRRIAAALEREPGEVPVERLAYHYGRGGEHDKAAQYLERAGARARAQHANVAAEGYYRDLTAALDHLGRTLETARAREKLGAVLHTLGRYEEALAVLNQAVETYGAAGERESLARTLAHIGRVHDRRGTPLDGIARIQPLLEHLDAMGPSHGLAALYAALPLLYFFSGRYGEQLAAAERARELAHLVRDDQLVAQAGLALGWALPLLGQAQEGLCVLEETCALAEAVGDLYTLSEAAGSVGLVSALQGEIARSSAAFDRAVAAAERLGDPDQIAHLWSQRGMPAFYAGRWNQARADFERGLVLTRQVEASSKLVYALSWQGQMLFRAGEWETAVPYLEEGVALAARNAERQGLRTMQTLLAERDLLEGRPDVARDRLIPLCDRPGLEEQDVTLLLPTLGWAYLELGDMAAAEEVATQAVRRARSQTIRVALVEALWVQAMLAIRQEQWAAATCALEAGLEMAQAMPYPYAEGRLLHVYGQMHLQLGEPAQAREWLEAALAIFRRLGARKDVERVEQVLATTG